MPNGIKTKRPNLNSCNPHGQRIIVIQQIAPKRKQASACSQPAKIIQTMLMTSLKPFKERNLGENPNGQNASLATLRYCKPTGMKMIVIKHKIAQIKEITASSQPIKSNQVTFANVGRYFSCLILEIGIEIKAINKNTLATIINAIAQLGNDMFVFSKNIMWYSFQEKDIKCPFC